MFVSRVQLSVIISIYAHSPLTTSSRPAQLHFRLPPIWILLPHPLSLCPAQAHRRPSRAASSTRGWRTMTRCRAAKGIRRRRTCSECFATPSHARTSYAPTPNTYKIGKKSREKFRRVHGSSHLQTFPHQVLLFLSVRFSVSMSISHLAARFHHCSFCFVWWSPQAALWAFSSPRC